MKRSIKLNSKQQEILTTLYKFRFVTKDLLTEYLNLNSNSSVQSRLSLLYNKGLIGRHYNGKDKILGKPAIYYLESLGIRYLLSQNEFDDLNLNEKVLNLIYKDKSSTRSFQEKCLTVLKLYNNFIAQYGNSLDFYTSSELHGNNLFLKPLPPAYIVHKRGKQIIIELFDDTKPYYTIKRRINQYLKQYQQNIWQSKTNTNYPDLLFIASSPDLKRRLEKTVEFNLKNKDISNLDINIMDLKKFI